MSNHCIDLIIVLKKLDFMSSQERINDVEICSESIIVCDEAWDFCDIVMDDPLEILLNTRDRPLLVLPRNIYLNISKKT